VNPLYRIPQGIDPFSSMKGVPTGGESPKLDKGLGPQAEKSTLDSLKPMSPRNAQGPTSTVGTLTSSFHATPSHDTTNIPQRPEPTEMSNVIPLSPRSYGVRALDGPNTGECSFVPSSEAQLRTFSHVAESLWDNPNFIEAEFHIGRFVTAVVDSETERENIKALFSSLETTSTQIKVIT
jgi:hypothetical protein